MLHIISLADLIFSIALLAVEAGEQVGHTICHCQKSILQLLLYHRLNLLTLPRLSCWQSQEQSYCFGMLFYVIHAHRGCLELNGFLGVCVIVSILERKQAHLE